MKPEAIIESVLFAAGEPVKLAELASITGVSKGDLAGLLAKLQSDYADRGIRLVFDKRTVQLVTAPEAAPHLARFIQAELRGKLSQSALETLAIVAYRGPVTRPDIEAIRGVDSSASLRTLSIRGLVSDVGRKREAGRPILYDTTLEFLKRLGLSSKDELPQISEAAAEKLSGHEAETAKA